MPTEHTITLEPLPDNKAERDYAERILALDSTPKLPSNGMDDWDAYGRLKPTAPAYTPFIRHREGLDLG